MQYQLAYGVQYLTKIQLIELIGLIGCYLIIEDNTPAPLNGDGINTLKNSC